VSMETLYEVAGISRQAFHNWLRPSTLELIRTPEKRVVEMAKDIRKRFLPGSSAREVYFYIRKKHKDYNSMLLGWGKHSFEALCLLNGLRIVTKRFIPKTTIRGNYVFANLIEGLQIDDINRIWVSDICYVYGSNGQLVGYATSLIDLYSRLLLGLSFSISMHAPVTSQEVIKQALEVRNITHFENLIFHSDGGKQYIENSFLDALRSRNIQSSMADNCYENAFAESFNDILKNHMLFDIDINSFVQLKAHEKFIKHCYNFNRNHSGILKLTPVEFEQHILTLQQCQRTLLNIKVIS
jgi:putative transposase